MPDGTRLRNIRVDDDLWAASRAEAERRGETLSDAIRRFLREYTEVTPPPPQ